MLILIVNNMICIIGAVVGVSACMMLLSNGVD